MLITLYIYHDDDDWCFTANINYSNGNLDVTVFDLIYSMARHIRQLWYSLAQRPTNDDGDDGWCFTATSVHMPG